jgi:hypothetical protein
VTEQIPHLQQVFHVGSTPACSRRIPTARQIYFDADAASEEDRQRAEFEFFDSIRLGNGTYKTTYAHRLDDLNEFVNPLLPRACCLTLMDVAVSSGITTLEWMTSLERAGIDFRMTAGDIALDAWLVSVGRHLHVLLDREGAPLQYDFFGRGVPRLRRRQYFARYSLPIRLLNLILCAARARQRLRESCPSDRGVIRYRRVSLVSPVLLGRPDVEIIEDDLSRTELGRRFTALRAANILNRTYFDEERIRNVLKRLRRRLVDGGLLIVCRTARPGVNDASVFSLSPQREFTVIGRLNAGSDVEDLVLGLGRA